MSYYLIRLGEGSKYIEEARKEGFIAIGWNRVPDLTTKVRSKKDERKIPVWQWRERAKWRYIRNR